MRRSEVMAYRIHAQQLDRPRRRRPPTDAAIFDFGIQDTGRDGASWALVNRGVPISSPTELEQSADVALAWTLRASPHYYRRDELFDAMVATSPLSEKDAVKRVIGAAKPLQEAGISTREGLAQVATELRAVVSKPLVKGEVSTRLTPRLAEPHRRHCTACQATHAWEIPFRISALYAGLELEPGTSPPVLRRVPEWPRRTPGPAEEPLTAPKHLQPIRNYLRFLGPATPQDVAVFLDSAVAEIKAHWPEDAVEVKVEGQTRWWLEDAKPDDHDPDLVRLLGPYDLLLQARDRKLVVPDAQRHKALWPVIGRPGAVLVGTEIVGSWRPRASGDKLSLRLELWDTVNKKVRGAVEEEAGRLAAHRGIALANLEID
jgi:hypothetical protein